ncbi:hypothetical protein [Ideonella dechloratans]|uniref:hypothetical protein n=1 Tax=Ideonella dechloratans TaxID=36863 RepID=UPI0035B258EC
MSANKMNRDAIFVSAGDREVFASFAIDRLSSRFDVLVNYYGDDVALGARLQERASYFQARKTTKFKGLKELYQSDPERVRTYRSVWVCDDDLILESGEVDALVSALVAFRADAVAPAFSMAGKISHPITCRLPGEHAFRFTNFIEMNAPMFSGRALCRYLDAFDGSLDGWGNDWWFLNLFDADAQPRVGIVDQVVMINPFDGEKSGEGREIDKAMPTSRRRAQWLSTRDRLGMREWPHRNLFVVTTWDPHPSFARQPNAEAGAGESSDASQTADLSSVVGAQLARFQEPKVLLLGAQLFNRSLMDAVYRRDGHLLVVDDRMDPLDSLNCCLSESGTTSHLAIQHVPLLEVSTFGIPGRFYDTSAINLDDRKFDVVIVAGPDDNVATSMPKLPALPALAKLLSEHGFAVILHETRPQEDRLTAEVWLRSVPGLRLERSSEFHALVLSQETA